MCLKKPFAVIEWNIDQVPLPERCATRCILTLTMDRHSGHSNTAVKSADRDQDNNHVFFLVYALVRSSWFYYGEYRKAIEDPDSSIVYRIVIQQYPYVLLTLVVAEEAGVMKLKPGTPNFTKCGLTECSGEEESVNIAPKVVKPTPEWIKEVCHKLLKPQDLEGFDDYRAQAMLPKCFKMVRINIRLSASKPAKLNFFVFFGIRGVHEIAERFLPRCSNPTISGTEPLDPSNYSPSFINQLLGPDFQNLISNAVEHASKTSFPLRNITYRGVLELTKRSFKIIDEPTVAPNAAAPTNQPQHAPQQVAPQQVAPQPAVPQQVAPQQELPQQEDPHQVAPQQEGAQQDAPQQEGAQQDAPQQEPATERPQSTISNDQDEYYDSMDDQGGEDFGPPMLDDDVAADPEQNPEDAPNPAATQGAISKRPNQANCEANLEAGNSAGSDSAGSDSAGSSADISYLAANRGRKRGVEEVLQEPQGSSTPNPKRLETDEMRAMCQKLLEAQKNMEAKIDSNTARIETVDGAIRANAAAIETIDGATRANTARIETVAGDTQANAAAIETVDGNTRANAAAIETVAVDAQANTTRIRTVAVETQANTARIETIDGVTQANAARIATVDGATQANAARIETVDGTTRANTAAIEIVADATRTNAAENQANTAAINTFTGYIEDMRAKETETGTQRNTRTGNGGPNFLPQLNAEAARQRETTQKSASDGPKGEDAAGAIPKQVVRELETETAATETAVTEVKEDEAGEEEARVKMSKIKQAFFTILLCLAVIFGWSILSWPEGSKAVLNATSSTLFSGGEPAPSLCTPPVETPSINCDNGKEAAAAFCHDINCIKEVYQLCRWRDANKNYFLSEEYEANLIIAAENILETYM